MTDAEQRLAVIQLADLLQQLAGAVQRGLGHADRHTGDQWTGVVKGLHDPGKALLHIDFGVAQQVGRRYATVTEADRGGIRGLDSELLLQPRYAHARGAVLDHKGLDRSSAQAL